MPCICVWYTVLILWPFFPLSVWNCMFLNHTLAIVHKRMAQEIEKKKIDDKNQCRCSGICLSYVCFFLSFCQYRVVAVFWLPKFDFTVNVLYHNFALKERTKDERMGKGGNKTSADREPSQICRIHFIFSQHEHRRGLPESRLYVLVSTQQAMHPIQRSLLTSAQGWRTIFCLRSEGEHTYTLANRQPDKHTLLLGVLLQYISSSLSSVWYVYQIPV